LVIGEPGQQRCQEHKTGHQEQDATDQAERVAGAQARRNEEYRRADKQDPAPQLKALMCCF